MSTDECRRGRTGGEGNAGSAPGTERVASLALPNLAASINAEHAAAEAAARNAVEHVIACGRLLAEAKEQVEHGGWIPWVDEHLRVTVRTAQRYMLLADKCDTVSHLPTVREALEHLAEPRERDALPSDRDTWSTPDWILEPAREVLGGIDLDPATNPNAAQRIGAVESFTADDDGLSRPWHGRVWLNPPYSDITPWIDKIVAERDAGRVIAAIVLLPQMTGSGWANRMLETAAAVWVPERRVGFVNPETGVTINGNRWGNCGAYWGDDPDRFAATFGRTGHVLRPWGAS